MMLFGYASCGVHLLLVGCRSSHLAVIEWGIGTEYFTCTFSKTAGKVHGRIKTDRGFFRASGRDGLGQAHDTGEMG